MESFDIWDRSDANHARRLNFIVELMREISRHNDPQQMVASYTTRLRAILPIEHRVSISRRGLASPFYKITRSTRWEKEINPWRNLTSLPVFSTGLLGELIYAGEPRVINDFCLARDDPAAEHFEGMRSLMVLPNFDGGVAVNMTVLMRHEPFGFDEQYLPEQVWLSNLFGRATQNLVLSAELKRAYDALDNEMKVVADIQQSLLPTKLPEIPTLDMAVSYLTSTRAGGDYYDFFPLPDGRWGILMADVSGHGTPAAVLMAITHSIAHTHHDAPTPPSKLLNFLNQHLSARYTMTSGNFVTAFYGIYDPSLRKMFYASAGHCPPRVKRPDGSLRSLDDAQRLPLGIDGEEIYEDQTATFSPGDAIVLYTDGITEARNRDHELFGMDNLDAVLTRTNDGADGMVRSILAAVHRFADGEPTHDDQTILAIRVVS